MTASIDTIGTGELDRHAQTVANFAERVLNLQEAVLHEAYYYQSLSLCVIDAVFSINARYSAVENVLARYCQRFKLVRIRPDRTKLPERAEQEDVAVLAGRLNKLGAEYFAAEIFCNRQRTSTRSGILKAEAVHRFANAVVAHGAGFFQDIPCLMQSTSFERAIRGIPGQASGISLQYFWMLGGSDNLVKPDRQIVRFVQRALAKPVSPQEASAYLVRAGTLLHQKYPHLTPRLLDYEAWEFEKAQPT